MTMDFTLSLDLILPSLWEQAHNNSKDPLLVFPTISGNSPISWKPRLNSSSKLGNSDLNANQGSESHVFLSNCTWFLFFVFFWKKRATCPKIDYCSYTHCILIPNSPPRSPIQKTKGWRNSKKEGRGRMPLSSKPFKAILLGIHPHF